MNVLIHHATGPNLLTPRHIRQAAERDIQLWDRKEQLEADPEEKFLFLNRHVRRCRGDVIRLIALAYIEGEPATRKEITQRIYYDRSLLRETLIELLIEQRPKEAP